MTHTRTLIARARFAWVLVPASILLGDIALVWRGLPGRIDAPGALIMSVVLSLCFWWAATMLAAHFKPWRLILCAALPFCGLLLGSAWLYASMTSYPNVTTLLYIVQEPRSAWLMSSTRASSPLPWLMMGVGALWAVAIWASARHHHDRTPFNRTSSLIHAASITLVLFVTSQLEEAEPFRHAPYQSDVRLLNVSQLAAQRLLFEDTELPIVTRRQPPILPEDTVSPDYDVLIFLTESLRPDHLTIYGYKERDTTPELQEFVDTHEQTTVVYERAFSNSAFTVFSMISLFSGLSINTPVDELASAPLLWHHAHALGIETFLISAQDLRWSRVIDFLLLADPPGTFLSAASGENPLVNDLGIDDRITASQAIEVIEALPKDKPFFGVVQTNSTHYPFFDGGQSPWPITPKDTLARYDGSVRLTDDVFGKLIEALRRTGRLERTFIIVLSDHAEHIYLSGQNPKEDSPNNRLRPSSCHPTITHIPLVLHIPRRYEQAHPDRVVAARQNAAQITSLLDVMPTVLDIWQVPDMLTGTSLMAPIPPERVATCFSPASSYPNDFLGFATYGKDHIFYQRQDFLFTEHYPVAEPATFSTWDVGAPLDEESRRTFERHMSYAMEDVHTLHEQVERARSGDGK